MNIIGPFKKEESAGFNSIEWRFKCNYTVKCQLMVENEIVPISIDFPTKDSREKFISSFEEQEGSKNEG